MSRQREPIDLTPPPRFDRWRVTARATGKSVVIEARIALDAYKLAALRDELGVLLHFSQVRVEPAPAGKRRNGKRHPKAQRAAE
jgi:hypothetical protein